MLTDTNTAVHVSISDSKKQLTVQIDQTTYPIPYRTRYYHEHDTIDPNLNVSTWQAVRTQLNQLVPYLQKDEQGDLYNTRDLTTRHTYHIYNHQTNRTIGWCIAHTIRHAYTQAYAQLHTQHEKNNCRIVRIEHTFTLPVAYTHTYSEHHKSDAWWV